MESVTQKICRRLNHLFGVGMRRTLLYSASPSSQVSVENPSGIALGVLRECDARLLNSISAIRERDIQARLTRGDLCYVAYLNGKPAHYSWVQRSGMHNIQPAATVHDITAGEIWIYHCETAPWARGHGIYPFVLCTIVNDRIPQGCGEAKIYTTSDNIASQKGILRAGFQKYATLRALRIGKWVFPWDSVQVRTGVAMRNPDTCCRK